MTKASNVGSSFVRIVHETLGSLAAPEVREELIRSALRMATAEELPHDAIGYANFVRGPLRAVMLDKLGAEITDSVADELEHVLRISSAPSYAAETSAECAIPEAGALPSAWMQEPVPISAAGAPEKPPSSAIGVLNLHRVSPAGESPTAGDGGPLSDACQSSQRPVSQAYDRSVSDALGISPERGQQPARVFVASQSETFVKGLAHFLTPKAVRIDDVMELLRSLSQAELEPAAIVLDCKRPSIRPIALAALADGLPPNVRVVLWGAGKGLRYQLARMSPNTSSWLNCSEDDDLQSVAQRCEALVG